jgi:glutamyl-tRNA synthetase
MSENIPQTVRTRFAPSPTGYLHVGNIRTGFFAWLIARHFGGQFILRLEDTDKKREVRGADEHLIRSLKALGVEWDEGFDIGGPYAPYRQSDRLPRYKEWAQKLIDAGRAYVDPYIPEEVQTFREQAQQSKRPFLYRNHRPDYANKPATEQPAWDGTKPLRFKADPKPYHWHDEVMGDLSTGPEVIDDFILIKSDGYPTYNFAHICDDADMHITHIIRGQEFIASMPNYLNLYEALDLTPPIMATMPHILGIDGNKKLSKRDGAKDVLDYIREGYLPDALVNFIASLGWNDGTEQEIFSRQELIEKFTLDRVQKSGARFDERRLLWMNGHYLRELPLDTLYELSQRTTLDAQSSNPTYWPQTALAPEVTDNYRKQVLGLVQERLKYLAELPELSMFFFTDLPVNPELITNHKQLKKLDQDELRRLLQQSRELLAASDFSVDDLTIRLNDLLQATGQKPAVLFSLVRIAITQSPASPGLADTLHVLGRERSLTRIDTQLAAL